jgi:hypothetical protein
VRRSLALLALITLLAPGCKPQRPGDAAAFAIAFVDAARAGKLDPDWVDDAVILRLRHAQMLQRGAKAKATPPELAKAWSDDPTPGLSFDQRSKLQRDRAAHGLSRALKGRCDARDDPDALAKRVEAITAPVEGAPADAAAELQRLSRDLSAAHLLRVSCDRGAAGLILIPDGKSWAVVDIFPLGNPLQSPPIGPQTAPIGPQTAPPAP